MIERLGSGAILNHQAFMIKDAATTDFVCRTPVSAFELSYEKMKNVMNRRADLQQARKDIEKVLLKPVYQVALDYIFHNNAESPEQYAMELHSNALKVKIKNAVMQAWAQQKREMQIKNINTLIEEMLNRKRRKDKSLGLNRGDEEEEKEKTED